MKKAKVMVFDFDGTLADSLDSLVDHVNLVAKKFGRKPFKEEQIEQFVTRDTGKWWKQLPVVRWGFEKILKLIENDQFKHVSKLDPVPGLLPVLKKLIGRGFRLGIVTSNSEVVVKRYLATVGWTQLFDFVYGGGGIFHKSNTMQTMLEQENLTQADVIYVGDEPRDVEVAHQLGISVVAVTWGFQPKTAFRKVKPNWLIDSPRELLWLRGSKPWYIRIIRFLHRMFK